MQGSGDVEAMLAESQKVIDEIQRQLVQSDEAIRAQGYDPDKVKAVLKARIGRKEQEETERLVAQDLAEVDREVEQAKARQTFSATGGKGGKKPRRMV